MTVSRPEFSRVHNGGTKHALPFADDEYADRPADQMHKWFINQLYTGEVVVIPGVAHSFHGGEKHAAKYIAAFMKERYN